MRVRCGSPRRQLGLETRPPGASPRERCVPLRISARIAHAMASRNPAQFVLRSSADATAAGAASETNLGCTVGTHSGQTSGLQFTRSAIAMCAAPHGAGQCVRLAGSLEAAEFTTSGFGDGARRCSRRYAPPRFASLNSSRVTAPVALLVRSSRIAWRSAHQASLARAQSKPT